MYIKDARTTPDRIKAVRIPQVSLIDHNLFSRKKIIKDYIYTPEFRVIQT